MVKDTKSGGAMEGGIFGRRVTFVRVQPKGVVTQTHTPELPPSARQVLARLPQTRK